MRGLTYDPAMNLDPFVVPDVHDFLFFNPRVNRVIDLAAININRGRDHGVPGYVFHLQYCTGDQITSWEDLNKYIPSKQLAKIQNVYR